MIWPSLARPYHMGTGIEGLHVGLGLFLCTWRAADDSSRHVSEALWLTGTSDQNTLGVVFPCSVTYFARSTCPNYSAWHLISLSSMVYLWPVGKMKVKVHGISHTPYQALRGWWVYVIKQSHFAICHKTLTWSLEIWSFISSLGQCFFFNEMKEYLHLQYLRDLAACASVCQVSGSLMSHLHI